MVFAVPLRPLLFRVVPSFLRDRLKPAIYGWEFLHKYEIFKKLGSTSFMLVTLGRNELQTADLEVVHAILTRRDDFTPSEPGNRKSVNHMFFSLLMLCIGIMGMFGPNVNTVKLQSPYR